MAESHVNKRDTNIQSLSRFSHYSNFFLSHCNIFKCEKLFIFFFWTNNNNTQVQLWLFNYFFLSQYFCYYRNYKSKTLSLFLLLIICKSVLGNLFYSKQNNNYKHQISSIFIFYE